MLYGSYFMTNNGIGVVYASGQGVIKVEIPNLSLDNTAQIQILPELEPSEISIYSAQLLQRYFKGERIDFLDITVLLDGLTPFRQKVLNAVRSIKYSETSTYHEVAEMCGASRAARAVGSALASNPVPIIIPCHRVVAFNGRLTGFSAPGGEKTKKALLKMEGVEFNGSLVVKNQLVIHSILN